jgi:hypothetical protein
MKCQAPGSKYPAKPENAILLKKVFDFCRPDFCVRTGDVEMGGDKGIILFKILYSRRYR